jgi:serine/threonine-protein kinase RsbW
MGKLEKVFSLHVKSSTENLAMIRQFVTDIGARAGLKPPDVNKLELAVDEACANIIEHAYDRDVTQEVVIRANFDEEQLQIELEDTGRGFDPDAIPQLELEELVANRKKGGLGLRLIKTLMDEVHYECRPGEKNRLRLVKRVRQEPS